MYVTSEITKKRNRGCAAVKSGQSPDEIVRFVHDEIKPVRMTDLVEKPRIREAFLAYPDGFEPATYCLEGSCSILLS